MSGGMKQFGPFPNDNFEIVPVPVGEICTHCAEAIAEEEPGFRYANGPVAHYECFMRMSVGSLAHIEKRCSCFVPGAECTDPPEMARREAARVAVAAWHRLQPR